MPITVSALTDIGRSRRENQDSIDTHEAPEHEFAYLLVADGMGGYTGGAVASQLAVEAVGATLRTLPYDPAFATSIADTGLCTAVDQALQQANWQIHEEKNSQPELSQMGTTLVVALIWGDMAVIGHIGDSRAYLWRGQTLSQLTTDHSMVQELVDGGALSPEEAGRHPHRNVLTRALGVDAEVQASYRTLLLEPGDRLLLCSDGLTTHLDGTTIARELECNRTLAKSCHQLVALANQAGGHDNISVAMAEYGEPAL